MRYAILHTLLFFTLFHQAKSDEPGFRFERDRPSVTIPIEVRNNLAVVPVSINERGPFYFILDTGVRTTILTEPMLAHLLDLEFEESIFIYGLGGEGIVSAALATGVDIRLPGIRGENMNMIVIPEDILRFSEVFGFPVYGILGYDFFKEFAVEINYANERMRLYRDQEYRIRRRSEIIPLRLVNGKPYVEVSIVGENRDTLNTYLLLDLGASHPIYLNRNYIHMSDRTINSFIGQGISGNLMGEVGRIKKIVIGETEIKEPLVFYPDADFLVFYDQEISWEGLIGGAIINRFNIIIDYHAEQLVLRPGKNFSKPFNTNISGIEVIAKGQYFNEFFVHYVRPGSAAYEAGLMAGDQIMQLNHLLGHQLNMEEILDILTFRQGYPVNMQVKRENSIYRKKFRLREDLQ